MQFDQSFPVQPNAEIRNLEKSGKILKNTFFSSKNLEIWKIFLFAEEEENVFLLVLDRSSPVHPVSDFRGGTVSVTNGEVRKILEILMSNLG